MKFRRAGLLLLTTLSALLVAAPAGAGTRGVQEIGRAWGAANAGGHQVLLPDAGPVLRVYDARTGVVLSADLAPGCRTVDIAAGRVLLECPGESRGRRYGVYDTRSGEVRYLSGTDPTLETYYVLGRYWLSGQICEPRCVGVFLNWATGEYRADRTSRRHGVDDPDRKDLGPVKPCAWTPNIQQIDGPRVLRIERRDGRRRLVLRQCGRKALTLDRCARGCDSLEARYGRVAWISGPDRLKVYSPKTRRLKTFRFAFPDTFGRPPGYNPRVDMSRSGAVLSVPDAPDDADATVYLIRFP